MLDGVFSDISIKGTLDILTSKDTKTRLKTNYIIELVNYVGLFYTFNI